MTEHVTELFDVITRAKLSPTMRRHTRMAAMRRDDPELYLLCRIEALLTHKTDNDVDAMSRVTEAADNALDLIEKRTGKRWNPLYGEGT